MKLKRKRRNVYPCPDCGALLYLVANRPVECLVCGNSTVLIEISKSKSIRK